MNCARHLTPLLVMLCVFPFGTRAWAQDPLRESVAQARFSAGKQALEAERWEEAKAHLEASLLAYDSPNTRLLLARTLVSLQQLGEAYTQYVLTSRIAEEMSASTSRYAQARRAAERELDVLRKAVGFLTFEGPAYQGLVIQIDGRALPEPTSSVAIPVAAGTRQVSLSAPGHRPRTLDVAVAGGETRPVRVFLVAEAPRVAFATRQDLPARSSHQGSAVRSFAIANFSLAGASLVSAAVLQGLAEARFRDLERACTEACPLENRDDLDRGRQLETFGNVGFYVSGVSATIGVILLVASRKARRSESNGSRAIAADARGFRLTF